MAPWVLLSAHEWSRVLKSSQECSLCHGTMLNSADDWSWLPISWALKGAHECWWLFMSTYELWALMSTLHYSEALISMVPIRSEHLWALGSTHEHLRVLMVQWQLSLNGSLVSKNATERLWALKTAPQYSLLLKRLIKKHTKYLWWNWPPWSNL